MTKPPLTLYLAAPRGFCAGVDRAIKIVEMALQKWGAPVYVRHEIVHNKFVVDSLRDQVQTMEAQLRQLQTAPPQQAPAARPAAETMLESTLPSHPSCAQLRPRGGKVS